MIGHIVCQLFLW